MTASPRFLAGRALALAFVLVAGTVLGVAVSWLWLATRAGDYRAFWILYVIAMIAIGVAVFAGRRDSFAHARSCDAAPRNSAPRTTPAAETTMPAGAGAPTG
jgi:F0F1-type ATP synthase assembly protein I